MMAITDPCVIRLLAEGGASEVFGRKEPDGSWSFITRGTNLEIDDDGNESIAAGGIPRCSELSEVLLSWRILFIPIRVHPELRDWFRQRYDAAVAVLPDCRRESHDKYRHHKWQALFLSTPPGRWSEEDAF